MTGVSIAGTGLALPARYKRSSELDAEAGRETGWLEEHCGVRGRYVVTGESQIDLGVAAAQDALAAAGLEPGDVDLILSASAVPYQAIPSTAPLYQQALGVPDGAVAAFDINATCLSFLTAFDMAAAQIATGRATRVLIISSEIASRGLPWAERPDVAGLFSDGAAAAVIAAGDGAAPVAQFETHPSAWEACQIQGGGTRFSPDAPAQADQQQARATFQMDGGTLFRVTAKGFRRFVDGLLERANWTRDDIALVVPHQASPGALQHLIRQCRFDPARVMDIAADYGNQIAASIPTALHLARTENRVRPGDKVLCLGTSAGVTFGGMALEV